VWRQLGGFPWAEDIAEGGVTRRNIHRTFLHRTFDGSNADGKRLWTRRGMQR